MKQLIHQARQRCCHVLNLGTVVCLLLQGCVNASLSQVDVDPNFDWDAMKRDEIVMTPLVDLRREPTAPAEYRAMLEFFSAADCRSYPEKFKQTFFHLRKDMHIYGAGGAFEKLAALSQLNELARAALAKEPFKPADVATVVANSQDIRFVFFFAIASENLVYDLSYASPMDADYDIKTYTARHEFAVKLALWDSKQNKIVWTGTQNLAPTAIREIYLPNPAKLDQHIRAFAQSKKPGSYVPHYPPGGFSSGLDEWDLHSALTTVAAELAHHHARFPGFVAREPAFSGSFSDFALTLPIEPSEQKLIEYTHFSYHRPELSWLYAPFGNKGAATLGLGASSVINYHWRYGAELQLPVMGASVQYLGETYNLSLLAFGVSVDYEWQFSDNLRLLLGTAASGVSLAHAPEKSTTSDGANTDGTGDNTNGNEGSPSNAEGTWMVAPRVKFLWGKKAGFQGGVSGKYRVFGKINDPVLKANPPAAWSLGLHVAWTVRGF